MRTIDDLDVVGRRVLVRADLNVPLGAGAGGRRQITDDLRIRASLPTVRALAERGARVVVCAHLGRPKGEPKPELSLAPVAERLSDLLGYEVAFATDTVGDSARATVGGLDDGQVALLENLRFHPGETSKDDAEHGTFADQLAGLAELYVGDGFGAVHRKHASVYDVPMRLPHAAGGLVLSEVRVLQRLTADPERPYVVVLGGAKVSDKLGVIGNLLKVVDRLVVGGGMVFTFLAARGYPTGRSLLEADQVDTVRGLFAEADKCGVEIVLPPDIVAAAEVSADSPPQLVPADAIPPDLIGLDIGPESRKLFSQRLQDARTVFWNGPMGVFELESFSWGTRSLAETLTEIDAFTVVGGGDSAAAVRQLGFDERAFGHISTGGGASLEYLEGKTLPGLVALED
jgi:phosphoglycerate kinase